MTRARITREVARAASGEVRYVYSFCSGCAHWHGFAWTLDAAYRQAEAHLESVHDVDPRTASTARRKAATRA